MKRATRSHRSEADWQSLIQLQGESGLSVRAFCKRHNIGDQSFYCWRKRLTALPAEVPAIDLVDITSMVSALPSRHWHIELDLGDGIKLNLRQV